MKRNALQLKKTQQFFLMLLFFSLYSCERNYTCSCKGPDTEFTTVIKSDSWDKAYDLCVKQENMNDSAACEILETQRKCY